MLIGSRGGVFECCLNVAFFFFQAEDGIRDSSVTGVQTCALPICEDAYFDSSVLSLLDRGFIYALVHIRGGSEMGRAWYEDGKLLKKKNTFTDFITCAEYLIAEKYTRPEKLFASGASAGGLLMGAVLNMRPDLDKGGI